MENIYVIVADNDKGRVLRDKESPYFDTGGTIILEGYVKNSSLDKVKDRIKYLGKDLGKCRIAKLVFIDEEK